MISASCGEEVEGGGEGGERERKPRVRVTWMTGRRNKIRSGNRGRCEVGTVGEKSGATGGEDGYQFGRRRKGREIEKGERWREGRASGKGP